MNNLVERFLKYVKIDTKSNPDSETCPSTDKQLNLANLLVKEFKDMGLDDVSIDNNGYIMATLKSNINKDIPTIGFVAHMDTSPDYSGENVNPNIVKNYDGKDIILNEEKNIVMSPKDFPKLKNYIGNDLITTDGTTLLGADNKAGIAEIMTAIEFLIDNPEIKHGDIKIGFTPDEEIGRGADLFDTKKFGADFAYTIDGGELGELQYENFNACGIKITINGRNIHPGSAKNRMINSVNIATELNSLLPSNEKPEYTEQYEGFFHLNNMEGTVEKTTMTYIIRDHCREQFEKKKELINKACQFLNVKYGENTVQIDMKDQYYNMKEKVEPVMHIVDTARKAMEELDINPMVIPIRGGTDGARLSYMGLPCPNVFTGGHNFHGKFEYISIQSMEKAVKVILKIIELYSR